MGKLANSNKVIAAIPDLHEPFAHVDAMKFVKTVLYYYKPDEIVLLGDELDFAGSGRYDVDPDGISPGMEFEAGLAKLKLWYDALAEYKVQVCTSNHTMRPWKKAHAGGLSTKFLKNVKDLLEAPDNWSWHDKIIIDDVQYEHGESWSGAQAALKAAKDNMRSTVIGHVHSYAGIAYLDMGDRLLFGVNSGCLIDDKRYCFNYAKHLKARPVLGMTIISLGMPHFIPMRLNTKGRWTGNI